MNTVRLKDILDLTKLELCGRYIFTDAKGKDFYGIKSLLEDLGIKRSELATYLGKTPQDLQNWLSPKSASFVCVRNFKDKDLLNELIIFCLALRVLVLNVVQLRNWLRLPNRAFDNLSPLQLILEGDIERVINQIFPLISGNMSS